jgi:hypothetical protein
MDQVNDETVFELPQALRTAETVTSMRLAASARVRLSVSVTKNRRSVVSFDFR